MDNDELNRMIDLKVMPHGRSKARADIEEAMGPNWRGYSKFGVDKFIWEWLHENPNEADTTSNELLVAAIVKAGIPEEQRGEAYMRIADQLSAIPDSFATDPERLLMAAQNWVRPGRETPVVKPVHKCLTCKNALYTMGDIEKSPPTSTWTCLLDRLPKRKIAECNRYEALDALTRRQAKEAIQNIMDSGPVRGQATKLIDEIYNGIPVS